MTNTLTTEEQTVIIESIKSLNPAVPSGERGAKDPGCHEHLYGFIECVRKDGNPNGATIVVLRNHKLPDLPPGMYEFFFHAPGTLTEVLNPSFEASGVPTVDTDGQALAYLQIVGLYRIVVHDPA